MSQNASPVEGAPEGRRTWSKRTLFLAILAAALGFAGVISAIVHFTIIRPAEEELRVAVIAPLSGPAQAQGEQIRRGAALFVDQVNQSGGLGGRPIKLLAFDDGNDPVRARDAAAAATKAGVIGVVGHWSAAAAAAAGDVYRATGIPAITPASDLNAAGTNDPINPWLFKTSVDQNFEIRFLANYVRNVIGEKAVSILYQGGPENEALAQSFDEVMQRFGTRVVYRWDYDSASPQFADRLKAITAEIKDKKLIGAFLVLGDAGSSAGVLAALRHEGISNRVIGPRLLATDAFHDALKTEWRTREHNASDHRGPTSVASALNGVLVTTPLLFDTAGELAQGFKNSYQKSYRSAPDWVAASGFDAMRLLIYAHGKPSAGTTPPLAEVRRLERERLAVLGGGQSNDGPHAHLDSLFGPVTFNAAGVSAPQTMIGSYDGNDLVAALTQLSPIREENVGNYLDELVAGRALYVNDRFMYKTNVVYAGVKMEKIGSLDLSNNSVALEFEIWFRWRGAIEPQDVVFTNSAEPIVLQKPEREIKIGDMTYRAYRTRGKFFLNYSTVERAYGTQVIGVALHHRTLSRNNLMYVSDILGMDLNSGSTLAEQLLKSNLVFDPGSGTSDASFFQNVAGLLSPNAGSTDPLLQSMARSRVLAGINGWVLDRAWISQDVARRGAEGDPAFVGFGKPQPEFSLLDMGSLLKPDQFDPRSVIPADWFLIIAIFSAVGSVVASLLDRKDRGQFWRMQTLGLRIISWPLLLLSVSNLTLDYGVQNLTTTTVDTMVMVFSSLWWLVPGRLLVISLERFVWVPLELRTGRKIPNVVRMLTALVIYLFAAFGVVAFVMGKTITSLLATSGLMAMIIGLAIQANIANIFSGIVLNIERPFSVGDYIKLNANIMGQVIDITWRTTRIRHLDGQLVCLANSKVSEAEIHNYSTLGDNFVRLQLYVEPQYSPRVVAQAVREALTTFDTFANLSSAYFGPDAQFKGVECLNGIWAARYRVKFLLKKGNDENVIVHELWARIWENLQARGIAWHQHPPISDPKIPPGPAPVMLEATKSADSV